MALWGIKIVWVVSKGRGEATWSRTVIIIYLAVQNSTFLLSFGFGGSARSNRIVLACKKKYFTLVSRRGLVARLAARCSSYDLQPEKSGSVRHVR